ncbi:MAG: inositol monophosphatase [Deltaproteobacteria bacterium]|nr:inositol monophosphatase [Deltaproteobacteria bacterium]
MNQFLKIALEAVRESGKIQMAKLGRVRRLRFKGEINPVTEVDLQCEATILKIIRKQFPEHQILSEEAGMMERPSDYRWIVDPLDGTANYSHGYPLFCTSIALEHRGRVIAGAVYEPNLDELFYAERGHGAFLNGRRIRVSKINRMKRALLCTGFAYDLKRVRDNNLKNFGNFIMSAQAVRRDGVAASDLCYVACGRFEGFWELGLWAWDVAAAALIIEEAGGKVSSFNGQRLNIYGREIVASNGLIHHGMLEVLKHGRHR